MRKSNALPSKKELEAIFRYDRRTGLLFWKARAPDLFQDTGGHSPAHTSAKWNARFAGKEALTKVNKGYRCGHLWSKPVLAHRVIWKIMTDEEADEVDHIDGDRANNRWTNLRNVTSAGNRRNVARRTDNKSGVTGVFWNNSKNCWSVVISVGTFSDFDQAVAARKAAEIQLGFHENHGR